MDRLPIALRAWSLPVAGQARRFARKGPQPLPRFILVFDDETTTDEAQDLTFGSYRRFRLVIDGTDVRLVQLEEGLFHADDLTDRNPDGLSVLQRHASRTGLSLMPASRFIHDVLVPKCYKRRDPHMLVGFNLPFDLSRLASGWGEARGAFEGGFSFVLETYEDSGARRENRWRPRIAVKTIDSKRHLMGFTSPMGEDREWRKGFRGHLLDCRTFAFAWTDESHSLASACKALGIAHPKTKTARHGEITSAYIRYNRRDVLATAEVFAELLREHLRHPIDLQPTKAFSPASVGKSYLRAMGISPILQRQPDFPEEVLAAAMSAYYGGRAECRIRKVEVPVVYLDFLSMYPTVNALMGLWRFVVAERIEVEDATEEIRGLLVSVSLEGCFGQALWTRLPALVQVVPEGDVMPVRAMYEEGGTWNIGVNPLWSDRPLWYALPDVIASTLHTEKAPKILRAIRLVPRGLQPGLRPVSLRGEVPVDPATEDFFKVVIEQRRRVAVSGSGSEADRLQRFLKVLASASSYGIYAEIVRHELSGHRREKVRVLREDGTAFIDQVSAVEEPGEYSFPPLACCITAAARLLLSMLERSVLDAGGSFALCDTDSMAVVATKRGGLIESPGWPHRTASRDRATLALSWDKVETIRERFAALNPYDPEAVPGSILKLEDENLDKRTKRQRQLFCLAISAKRYALFNRRRDGEPILRKVSEHGLGHLLNPLDAADEDRRWIDEIWRRIIAGSAGEAPAWFGRPAVGRITASTPQLTRPFARAVRPFSFLMSVQVAPFGHPEGTEPARFHLVAPFDLDASKWLEVPWTDLHTGRRYRIITETVGSAGTRAVVKSNGDVFEAYLVHPESKSLGPDGRPCRRDTAGLLSRRPVNAFGVRYIGKESNRLEDVEAGTVHELGEVLNEYRDPERDSFDAFVRPVLAQIPKYVLAEAVGIHPRKVAAIRNGHARPRSSHRLALIAASGDYARKRLQEASIKPPRGDLAACRRYLEHRRG